MGFWDRKVRDSFDEMFDLDRNGYLDPIEQAMQFDSIYKLDKVEESEEEDIRLVGTSLDISDLEFMDEDELREALKDEGLDPDDFDDLF